MFRDKFFRSKAFIEAQLWIFNGFSAVSLGFYFSLFSAGSPEKFPISLQLATVLFGIGLVTNSSLAFLILISGKDTEFLEMLNRSRYFGWVPVIAIYSEGFAAISLIAFYSWLAFAIVIATTVVIVYLFYRTMKHEQVHHKILMSDLERKKNNINKMLDHLKNEHEKKSNEG